MLTKLPDEIHQAIQQSPSEVRLQDEQTQTVNVVVDEATHRRATKAPKAQEDWESIQCGLSDRAQRNELPLAEADAQMLKELGFPPRS